MLVSGDLKRGSFLIVFALALAFLQTGASAVNRASKVPRLIFPVVGAVSFSNDFGDPRGQGSHQGNDLMAEKKSLVVAVERGKIKFWNRSASAGCMLYLYGASGTVYQYIHLNNDRTMDNDNRGRCIPGIAFARGLKNGSRVTAGQPIGFVGDSGDANGIASHLHFEIHPRGGGAVCPFPYLKKARTLLFAAPPRTQVSLTLKGLFGAADLTRQTLTMELENVAASTGQQLDGLSRTITLALPAGTLVINGSGEQVDLDVLGAFSVGESIQVATTSTRATLAAELGSPKALTAFSVSIPPASQAPVS